MLEQPVSSNPVELVTLDDWFTQVYQALHETAAYWFGSQPRDHTLQPTALVHETYLRLAKRLPATIPNRRAFFVLAARAMRHALVDHARRRAASKRATPEDGIRVDAELIASSAQTVDIIAMHDAIESLNERNPRAARVVELRVFGGLPIDDIADALRVSRRTVNLDWRFARAWLLRELGPDEGVDG